MKIETVAPEEWPDPKAEFKQIAERTKDGNVVKVDLAESALNKEQLIKEMRPFGRFEYTGTSDLVFIRASTKPQRTRTPKPIVAVDPVAIPDVERSPKFRKTKTA